MFFDKKKIHLIPPSVIDVGEKIFDKNTRMHHKDSYVLRLEATKQYIDMVLAKHYKERDAELNKKAS